MGELLVQDTSVIATADAIREKIGTSAKLDWVANKGFADVIKAIVSNNSLPSGVTAISTGSIVFQDINAGAYFKHGLGRVPNFIMLFVEGGIDIYEYEKKTICSMLFQKQTVIGSDGGFQTSWYYNVSNNIGTIKAATSHFSNYGHLGITAELFKPTKINVDQESTFKEGITYRWVAAYIEGI